MAQSGIIPPLGPQSALPVFDAVFADIGDRQSIAASLSTFSAHVAALRDLLQHAGPGSLVLLDEIGSGTDRKSTRLNSSHSQISYAVFCLKKKKNYTSE